jgi:hypothetical protein
VIGAADVPDVVTRQQNTIPWNKNARPALPRRSPYSKGDGAPKKEKGCGGEEMISHKPLRYAPFAPDAWWFVPWLVSAVAMLAMVGLLVFLVLI